MTLFSQQPYARAKAPWSEEWVRTQPVSGGGTAPTWNQKTHESMLRFPFSLQTQQGGYSITVDKEAVIELYAAESGDDKEDAYLGYGRVPLHDIFLWAGGTVTVPATQKSVNMKHGGKFAGTIYTSEVKITDNDENEQGTLTVMAGFVVDHKGNLTDYLEVEADYGADAAAAASGYEEKYDEGAVEAGQTCEWTRIWDPSHEAYYYQHCTSGETTWDEPAGYFDVSVERGGGGGDRFGHLRVSLSRFVCSAVLCCALSSSLCMYLSIYLSISQLESHISSLRNSTGRPRVCRRRRGDASRGQVAGHVPGKAGARGSVGLGDSGKGEESVRERETRIGRERDWSRERETGRDETRRRRR